MLLSLSVVHTRLEPRRQALRLHISVVSPGKRASDHVIAGSVGNRGTNPAERRSELGLEVHEKRPGYRKLRLFESRR
jgi:hypothetical protein